MGMADLPGAAFSRSLWQPMYRTTAEAASVNALELRLMKMTTTRPDFRKALDGIVGARTREATRQIGRRNEYLLLGAFTKRPN
jgi:hypothetical protein